MTCWLPPALFLGLLLTFSIGQDGQVCHHKKDITELWVIQCYGLNATNAGQLKLVLMDATRLLPHKKMLVEVSYSDGAAVPEDVFDGYWVETLTMKSCNFTSLPFQVISNMSEYLLDLDLGDNLIADVDFERFNEMPYASKLRYLGLYNNRVASLPEDALVNFTKLDTLDLHDNLLEELADNTFRGMANLRNLHLFDNRLNSIGQDTFADLQNLHLLTLENNRIQFLEEGSFPPQNQSTLEEVALEGNPFYCNCTLQWLKDYLTSIHYLDFSGATCVYPQIAKFRDVDFCATEGTSENDSEDA